MPHQNVHSTKATSQNAATDPIAPNDEAREQHRSVKPDPQAYVARDARDATVAPPAAGEMADYMDEGDPSFGAFQGRSNTNRELHAHNPKVDQQGARTRAANKAIFSGKSGPGGAGGK